ncbi:MAG TPA: DUF3347 domain-containing protein [Phnomibacter sp.]|nr:DUF3347 domain-containing protein [Phnomibacter sp.]
MRKILILLVLIGAAALVYRFVFYKKDSGPGVPALKPMEVQGATDAFTQSMTQALGHYYQMKDALVLHNADGASTAATQLAASLDSLNIASLKADSMLVVLATSLKQTVSTRSLELVKQQSLEDKRRAFQGVSDGLYDLLRTVQYKGSKVYQQYCPMAFNNTGAAWLSAEEEIVNPYFGDKMLNCGELRDSLRF